MKNKKIIYGVGLFLFILLSPACTSNSSNGNSLGEMVFRFLFRTGLSQTSLTGSGSTQLTSLPSKITVSVPRSIRSSDSTSIRVSQKLTREDATTVTAKGYQNLTEIVDKMFAILGQSKLELILLDKMAAEAKTSNGVCIEGGTKEIEVTSDMEAAILASMQDYGLTEASARTLLTKKQEEGTLPKVGQKLPSPPVRFVPITAVSTDASIVKDYGLGYRQMVQYTIGTRITDKVTCPSNAGGYTKTMKFDDTFSRVFYQLKASLDVPGIAIEILSGIVLTKGDKEKKTTDTMVFTMTTKETKGSRVATSFDKNTVKQCKSDEENTDKCIRISSTTTLKNGGSKNEFDMKLTIDGKITDNGGFIKTEHTDFLFGDKLATGSVATNYIRELFDGTGKLLGLEFSKDGKNYKPAPGFNKIEMTSSSVTDMFGGEKFDGFGMGDSGMVFIGFKTKPAGIGGEGIQQLDKFHIYKSVADTDRPSGFDDPYLLGEGEYMNPCFNAKDSGSCTPLSSKGCVWNGTACKHTNITGDYIFLDYWGTEDSIPQLTLWRRSISSAGIPSYTKVTGTNTFQKLDKNPYISPTSPFYNPFTDPNFDPNNSCYVNPASCMSAGGTFNMTGGKDCATNPTDPMCTYDPANDVCWGKDKTACDTTWGCTFDPFLYSCMNTFGSCWAHFNGNSCSTSGCEWSSSFYMCQPVGGAMTCSSNATIEGCFAYPNCTWYPTDNFCKENTMGFGVDPMAASSCPGALQTGCEDNYLCSWDSITGKCNVSCYYHYEATACNGSPAGCSWDSTYYWCDVNTGGTVGSCSAITDPASCLSPSCSWDNALNICMDMTPPPTSCSSYDQSMCTSMGCSWDSMTSVCVDTSTLPACTTHTEPAACANAVNCIWDGVSTCEDKPTDCSSHATEAICSTMTGCNWTGTNCVVANGCVLYKYDTSTCNLKSGCYGVTSPFSDCLPCGSISNITNCNSMSTTCMWDTTSNICVGKPPAP
jgi:hypothetical protein